MSDAPTDSEPTGPSIRGLLIELMAIKLYEHDCIKDLGKVHSWNDQGSYDREEYRKRVLASGHDPEQLYEDDPE